MRTPLIAANWKMFKTIAEAQVFVRELANAAKSLGKVDLVVAPPFTAVAAAVMVRKVS